MEILFQIVSALLHSYRQCAIVLICKISYISFYSFIRYSLDSLLHLTLWNDSLIVIEAIKKVGKAHSRFLKLFFQYSLVLNWTLKKYIFVPIFQISIRGADDSLHVGTFEKDFLEAHNKYRALHGVGPLELDRKLSKYAEEWARHLAFKNVLETRPNCNYGENIYKVSSTDPTFTLEGNVPVEKWWVEHKILSPFILSTIKIRNIQWDFIQILEKKLEKEQFAIQTKAKFPTLTYSTLSFREFPGNLSVMTVADGKEWNNKINIFN